jgi:F-type H+-transporting ATPase subunit b
MNFNLTLILEIVTFLILLFLLNKFVFRILVKKLDERKQYIDNNLDQIERLKKEAWQDRQEASGDLLEAKKEALKIKEEAFLHSEKLKEAKADQARKEAQKIQDKAREEVASYVEKVKEELKGYACELSFDIAAKILAKEVDRKKHKDLVEESLRSLHEQRSNYF